MIYRIILLEINADCRVECALLKDWSKVNHEEDYIDLGSRLRKLERFRDYNPRRIDNNVGSRAEAGRNTSSRTSCKLTTHYYLVFLLIYVFACVYTYMSCYIHIHVS